MNGGETEGVLRFGDGYSHCQRRGGGGGGEGRREGGKEWSFAGKGKRGGIAG